MNSPEMSTLAALAGSAIGSMASILSSHLSQRGTTQRELLSRELTERQNLYAEFIRFAATVYVQATTSSLDKSDDLVLLYALVGRIRLLASEPVIKSAESFAQMVTKRYGEQNLSLEALRQATLTPHVDPLYDFSTRCREEIRQLLRRGIA
jgi:hypothetical protein